MKELEPPVKQYLLGKLPSHSDTAHLADHFHGLSATSLNAVLQSGGYIESTGGRVKPLESAVSSGLIDKCGKVYIWNIEAVAQVLAKAGLKVKRQYANQTLKIPNDGTFVSLSDIARHFNQPSTVVGKWLEEAGVRKHGKATEWAYKNGLAKSNSFKQTTNANKKKSVTYDKWNAYRTVKLLMSKGHPLDFDYQKSLKGSGKNSEVTVSNDMEKRVSAFLGEFVPLYNGKDASIHRLVAKTPTAILKRAEKRLGKPGFLLKETYRQRFA